MNSAQNHQQAHQQAWFRADASVTLGIGHIMRCQTLAEGLKAQGWQCGLIASGETFALLPAQAAHNFTLPPIMLKADLSPAAQAATIPAGTDLLIVDHYELDSTFESAARRRAQQIWVMDDLVDRPHDCDLLIDTAPTRSAEDYRPLVPEHCTLLLGTDYALLRPQFTAARPGSLRRRAAAFEHHQPARQLLVAPGSNDPDNLAALALQAARACPSLTRIDIVLGSRAPHLEAVEALAATLPIPTHIHHDVQDMASLMAAADLAIGAGGTSSWERCCLGLPTLLVTIADNQHENARLLQECGAARWLGDVGQLTPDTIAQPLLDFATSPAALWTSSQAAAALCDGDGLHRILHHSPEYIAA